MELYTNEQLEKYVDRVLKSEDGRKILQSRLGAQVEEAPQDLPIVAVCVPCYKQPHPRMQDAFSKMIAASRGHLLAFNVPLVQSSVVHWCRNELLAQLVKSGKEYTHVLFIDDDICPEPDALLRLLSHGKDIVGALCTRRSDPPIPTLRHWDESRLEFIQGWDWKDGLIEADAIGTGMILLSRNAVHKIAEAYIDCLYEKEAYRLSDDAVNAISKSRQSFVDEGGNAHWFRFLQRLNGAGEYGEDISFCLMAKRYCGLKVYVDTSVQPDHIGDYGFSIKDFLPYQKAYVDANEARERMKRNLEESNLVTQ